MAISPELELMYAILAMDSYNRGYKPGILLESTSIGTATIFERDAFTTNAEYQAWQDVGFYGSVYEWNSETVISYRGTDSGLELLVTDYPLAGNDNFDLPQVHLASQFFQDVTASPLC